MDDRGEAAEMALRSSARKGVRREPAQRRHAGASARRIALGALLAAYAILWIGGVGSRFVLGATPPDAAWTAPCFLALAALIVAATSSPADLRPLVLAALAGFGVEVVGVASGAPFGSYAYTRALGPSLGGVPLVMACAWMILTAYAAQIALSTNIRSGARAIAAGAWMAGLDLVIDPLASGPLDYWRWRPHDVLESEMSGPLAPTGYYGVPAVNFLGWFAVSTILQWLLMRRARPSPWPRWTGLSILLFFTAIALAERLWPVALLGVALAVVHGSVVKGWADPPAAPGRS